MKDQEINNLIDVIEYKEAEWVFQFDNDEPVVFAWSNDGEKPGEVKITLKSDSKSTITFVSPDGTKALRLYCREMSDATRKIAKQ